jgi:hypothetical protein
MMAPPSMWKQFSNAPEAENSDHGRHRGPLLAEHGDREVLGDDGKAEEDGVDSTIPEWSWQGTSVAAVDRRLSACRKPGSKRG